MIIISHTLCESDDRCLHLDLHDSLSPKKNIISAPFCLLSVFLPELEVNL